VTYWFVGFLTLCIGLAGVSYLASRDETILGYALLMAAFPAFAVGIFAPMLMIRTTLNLLTFPLLLQFQSKSVIGSIGTLFGRDQYFLALAILLFSVAIPVFKSTILLFFSHETGGKRRDQIHQLCYAVGAWSMAEIFIVAALLVFFGSGSLDRTAAEIEPGTWYFGSYVIMSIIASLLLGRSRPRQTSTSDQR